MFYKKRGLHTGCPEKGNGQKKIDIGTVGNQRHNGFTAVRELAFNSPTKNTEKDPARVSSQKVTALGQFISKHLPLH
jgi:hypothetical protein